MDRKKDGSIDVAEFVQYAHILLRGTMDEKLACMSQSRTHSLTHPLLQLLLIYSRSRAAVLFLFFDSNGSHILVQQDVCERIQKIGLWMSRIDPQFYFNKHEIERMFALEVSSACHAALLSYVRRGSPSPRSNS